MSSARPWSVARIRAAISRRVRGPYAGLDRIEQRLQHLESLVVRIEARDSEAGDRLDRLGAEVDRLGSEVERLGSEVERLGSEVGWLSASRDDLRRAVRALAADEARNRRLLATARADGDYERAWTDDSPLITVTVATIGRPELVSRSLPSILAQSHEDLEVVVAADGAPADTESAVAALGDPRIRYLDLGAGATWTDDPVRLWLVGATRARNAALGEARGAWIVEFDDDDALRPECLEMLLDLARSTRGEAVYGQVRQHGGGEPRDFCEFPPRLGRFSWAGGMYHAGLRFFGRELLAADLGLPGDWWLAERMLRAGVRFAMRDEVLCDAHASDRGSEALERGRIPWSGDAGGSVWG